MHRDISTFDFMPKEQESWSIQTCLCGWVQLTADVFTPNVLWYFLITPIFKLLYTGAVGLYFCVMQSFVFYLGSPEKIEVFLHFNKTTTKWNPQSDLGQEKEILSYFTCHLRDCHFLLDLNDLHEKEESGERRSWRNKIILAPPGSLLVISTAGGRSNFLESKGRSEQNGNLDEERNERQIVMERLGKAKREAGS